MKKMTEALEILKDADRLIGKAILDTYSRSGGKIILTPKIMEDIEAIASVRRRGRPYPRAQREQMALAQRELLREIVRRSMEQEEEG